MENESIRNDYRRLETTARKALENPDTLGALPPHIGMLRLWHYPAFESSTSWLICHGSTPALFVRRVTWEYVTDQERFFDRLQAGPERFVDRMKQTKEGTYSRPTLLVEDFSVESAPYHIYVSELLQHPIPAVVPNHSPLGMDGVLSGIETSYGSTRLCLEWWEDGPPEWKSVITAARRLRQFLSQHA